MWSFDTPILPAPDWVTSTKPVFTSATLPVEIRESLSNLDAMIGSLGPNESKTTTSYDIPNLGLLGTSKGGSAEVEGLLAATFQAQPFAEPFTRKFYVRERWYDPMTGTWLTPDPMGYKDSSNLYAFAAGDPVNGRDSTGLLCDKKKGESWIAYGKRCAQEGLDEAKKQGAYIVGGVVNAAVLPFRLFAQVATFVQDPPALPSDFVGLSREQAARKHQQNAAIKENVLHPIKSARRRWDDASNRILNADASGHHMEAGFEAAEYGSQEGLTVIATAETGVGLVRLGARTFTRSTVVMPVANTTTALPDGLVAATDTSTSTALNTYYPPNRGFTIGMDESMMLEPGMRIDRHGRPAGTFSSPEGTLYTERALPPGSMAQPYYVYEVLKPFVVRGGPAATWFGELGGGIQYETFLSMGELEKLGFLKKVVGP